MTLSSTLRSLSRNWWIFDDRIRSVSLPIYPHRYLLKLFNKYLQILILGNHNNRKRLNIPQNLHNSISYQSPQIFRVARFRHHHLSHRPAHLPHRYIHELWYIVLYLMLSRLIYAVDKSLSKAIIVEFEMN
jgi:hypothetical protein